MPPEKRARVEAIIAKTQTPGTRGKSAADRQRLAHQYGETGRITTRGTDRRLSEVDSSEAARGRGLSPHVAPRS